MKTKRLWTSIFATIASVCFVLGIACFLPFSATAESTVTFTEVDVTKDFRIHYWSNDSAYEFLINFGYDHNTHAYAGDGTSNYDLNETPDFNGCDLMSYIKVNGKTLREVVGGDGKQGSVTYPSTTTKTEFGENNCYAPFKLRNMTYSSIGLRTFDLWITPEYVENVIGGIENVEITVMAGISWETHANENGVYERLITTQDVTYKMTDYAIEKKGSRESQLIPVALAEKDITKDGYIYYWSKPSDTIPKHTFLILFGNDVNVKPFFWIPMSADANHNNKAYFAKNTHQYLNNNPYDNGCDLMSYVKLNGTTLRDIVGGTGTNSNYSKAGDMAFNPVQLKSWDYGQIGETWEKLNGMELIVSDEYINEIGGVENLEITLMDGFSWINSDFTELQITHDLTLKAIDGITAGINQVKDFEISLEKVDITNTVENLYSVTDKDTYYEIYGAVPGSETWAPFCGNPQTWDGRGDSLYLNDNPTKNGCDLASYLMFNGVSARSYINNGANYSDTVLDSPSVLTGTLFRPIIVLADGRWGGIRLYVSKEWVNEHNNGSLEGLEITLKAGFEWDTVEYKTLYTSEDVTWKYKDGGFVDTYVTSASVSCKDSLDLNFYVKARSNVSELGGLFNDSESVNGVYDDADKLWKFTYSVAAKDYENEVSLTINGKTWTTSVANYLDSMPETDASYAVVQTIKTYCAAANAYFTGATVTETDALTADLSAYKATASGEQAGVTLMGATLVLEGKTQINIYFKATDLAGIECKVNDEVVTPEESGNYYVISIKGLTSIDLDTMFTVVIGGITVNYSALSYVEAMHGSADVALANVVKALYAYSAAAEEYFN